MNSRAASKDDCYLLWEVDSGLVVRGFEGIHILSFRRGKARQIQVRIPSTEDRRPENRRKPGFCVCVMVCVMLGALCLSSLCYSCSRERACGIRGELSCACTYETTQDTAIPGGVAAY